MTVQFEGMEEIMRNLERMGRSLDSNVRDQALKEGANLMKEKAKAVAPTRTGKLKESINISDVEDGQIHIGPTDKAFYAKFVELGTKKMSAKPFLGPAYENSKDAVQSKMTEVIRRELGL